MKIKNNLADNIMEVICLILMVGIVLYLILVWNKLPDKIPAHYDWAGNVDRWGSKGELLILPIMTWIMYGFISVVELFPKAWNTGVKVTEENQARVYRVLKYMIKSLKLIVVLDFSYMTINSILGKSLPGWFLPVFLGLTFGDLIFWLVKLVRVK